MHIHQPTIDKFLSSLATRLPTSVRAVSLGLSLSLYPTLSPPVYADDIKTLYCLHFTVGENKINDLSDNMAHARLQVYYKKRGWITILSKTFDNTRNLGQKLKSCRLYALKYNNRGDTLTDKMRVRFHHGSKCHTKQKAPGVERHFMIKRGTASYQPWICSVN